MFIQTQETPNPAVLKFLPGQTILEQGTLDCPDQTSAQKSPLAMRLFSLSGVSAVFLGQDFVSVTKDDNTGWNMLKPMILTALMEHLATGQPIVTDTSGQGASSITEDDDEIVIQIKQLLEERVRPAVMQDGGDIIFDRFEDGVVYLQMQGACAGCPSSTMTLKSGIENMLRHYVPEVEEVRPVDPVW